MIAAWCLCALLAPDVPRVALAQVEVSGPCEGLELELPGAGRLSIAFGEPLRAAERRSVWVAVPMPPETLPVEVWSQQVGEALASQQRAKLVKLEPPVELDGIAAELLARPRPELEIRGPRLAWSALFVLGAAFSITLAQRRRPVVVTSIALLAAGSIVLLTHRISAAPLAAARILEARLDATAGEPWLCVEVARERLASVDPRRARIATEPRRAEVHCDTEFPSERIDVSAPGALLYQSSAFDPGSRRLTREVNAFGGFEEAWLRDPAGTWSRLGPWPLGEALPAGSPGYPPGWLVPPLPMGISIFLGRVAPAGLPPALARPASPVMGASTWVRGVGL